MTLLAKLPAVSSVYVDDDARTVVRHGEFTYWASDVLEDLSYLTQPDRWILHFVGRAHGLPDLDFNSWFGIWKKPLDIKTDVHNRGVFIGAVTDANGLANQLNANFPHLPQIRWDTSLSLLENIIAAAECNVRVVAGNEEMAALTCAGLECLVLATPSSPNSHPDIFRLPGARLCSRNDLLDIVESLLSKQPVSRRIFTSPPVSPDHAPLSEANCLNNTIDDDQARHCF